jgi:RHH-type transcriptional regulator, proline utilization regulon repressor / proline dehydrogenase / delta 1-pyrroline-5-carboxylate dehydrogenase
MSRSKPSGNRPIELQIMQFLMGKLDRIPSICWQPNIGVRKNMAIRANISLGDSNAVCAASSSVEATVQSIATELLAATRQNRSLLSQMRDKMRWDDKLLAWTMGNPGLRVQLFRFIDCLPALTTKAEVARHLQEYLTTENVELPAALKGLLGFTNPDSVAGQLAATTVSTAIETLARKYIAGEKIEQIIKTVAGLRKDKMGFTIDLLGEAVIAESEAQSYLDRYLETITKLATAAKTWQPVPAIDRADGIDIPTVQVSVKLTAFYSQFDPLDPQGSQEKVCDRLRILLRHAQSNGVAVHFDMEQYEYKAVILEILKQLLMETEFRQRTDIGLTIQAYLRDSTTDLMDLITWAQERGYPVTVRLVKGAYWDRETIHAAQKNWPQPVYNDKAATDINFEKLTQLMLENHQYIYSAIASHNVRSQAKAIALAQSLAVPKHQVEFQMLYGMGDKLAKAIVDKGYRVRIYCPYGDLLPGMSYLIRRLLENTANSSFLRQNLEERPISELIAPPIVINHEEFIFAQAFANAADTDYAQEQSRQTAQQAFAQVRQSFGSTYLPLIDGQYQPAAEYIDSVNPSNYAEVVGKIGMTSIELAQWAMAAAKAQSSMWRDTPASQRIAVLAKAADLIAARRAELAATIVLEVGKPLRDADGEISEAIDFCRYYGAEMARLDLGTNYDIPGENNRYFYRAKGITVVIAPWNFPFAIPLGMVAASLVAGNCTILKPAETSSVIAAKLAEILVQAGIPAGVFQLLPGSGRTIGSYLVRHPAVHTIAFTGSQSVGCQIYADAAILQPGQKHLKRVIAEMGGKNAIIIDESADLDQAVAGVVQSTFGYSGQKCSACSRAIVLSPIYDAFVERLVAVTRSLNIGPAELSGTQVGPVIDGVAQARIQDYIATGKTEARVALELPVPPNGYFVGPTIFTEVPATASIANGEIFGPVLATIRAGNFEEALEIANGTDYALTGGLYSRTPSHIDQAQREFEVGNLYINRGITGAIVARQPFGGFKLSGVGSKAGGADYLLQFLEPRVVTENIQRQGFAPIEGVDTAVPPSAIHN